MVLQHDLTFCSPFLQIIYDVDRLYKGLVNIWSAHSHLFHQKSVNSISFTTESAKPFERIFVLSASIWVIFRDVYAVLEPGAGVGGGGPPQRPKGPWRGGGSRRPGN